MPGEEKASCFVDMGTCSLFFSSPLFSMKVKTRIEFMKKVQRTGASSVR